MRRSEIYDWNDGGLGALEDEALDDLNADTFAAGDIGG